MDPVFTLPYSEFMVVQELVRNLKKQDGFSAFLPLSRQEKSVDFIIYCQPTNKYARFQVKASRPYGERFQKDYQYTFWFNNFIDKYKKGNCDYYCFCALYPDSAVSKKVNSQREAWRPIVLCLSDDEMGLFLRDVKTKKPPKKPDRFFGLGFDEPSKVFATRGFAPHRDVSRFLLGSMSEQIRAFLS